MPKVTRWMIKAGLIYLAAGVIIAGLHDVHSEWFGLSLLAVYWHMIVMGWITQVIMGVSIWMFPGRRRGKAKEEPFLPWVVFGLLNTGLIARFASEPFLSVANNSAWIEGGMMVSALLQTGAIAAYLSEMWPRVQAKKARR
jgi:hypothetical protein